MRWLLLQPHHPAAGIQLGHAEGGGIGDPAEGELGVGALLAEVLDQIGDAAGDEVVPEVHQEVVFAQEVAGDEDGMGEAERFALRQVGHLETEL